MDNTECLATCPWGQYRDANKKCRRCQHPCTHCAISSTKCTTCAEGFIFNGRGICEPRVRNISKGLDDSENLSSVKKVNILISAKTNASNVTLGAVSAKAPIPTNARK